MKKIREDIEKKQFKRVYLLYGEEAYLRLQYRDKLVRAVMPEEDTMNYAHFSGKGISEGAIIDLAETMPFFADYRVIVLEDTGLFKSAAEKLPEYLKTLPEYLVMIFVEDEVDKRSRMYKAVQKAGYAAEFSKQTDQTLVRWILDLMKRNGRGISRADAEYLLTRTGTDMSNIYTEVEKLICYTWERSAVTRQDIDAISVEQIDNRIFDMVRAVTERNQKKALGLYYDLLTLKEPPMRILFLIARQFNQLLQARELIEMGCGQKETEGKLGLPGFAVRSVMNCARQYKREELEAIVRDCVQTEEDVKTGRLTDALSVELLIVRYSVKPEDR